MNALFAGLRDAVGLLRRKAKLQKPKVRALKLTRSQAEVVARQRNHKKMMQRTLKREKFRQAGMFILKSYFLVLHIRKILQNYLKLPVNNQIGSLSCKSDV